MKKTLLLLGMALSICAFSQVGVDTDSPTETLDVNGNTRVRSLPINGATNAISTMPDGTASSAKDQTFTATKTVVADDNGVLGVVDVVPEAFSESAYGFKAFPEVAEGNSQVDAIVVAKDCLRLMLDPEKPGAIRQTYLYAQIDPACAPTSTDPPVTTTRATALESGADDGNGNQQNWARLDVKISNGTSQTDFTYLSGFYHTISNGPIFHGTIFLPDLEQLYEFTYTGDYHDDGANSEYEIGIELHRLH